jgi:hypothetical protein
VEIRGWRSDELTAAFADAGFTDVELFGGYDGAAFEPDESRDLIFVARSG